MNKHTAYTSTLATVADMLYEHGADFNIALGSAITAYKRKIRLAQAFDLVKNPTNWKLPIDAVVPQDADLASIREAIHEYTGTHASFMSRGDYWRVEAQGYYVGIDND